MDDDLHKKITAAQNDNVYLEQLLKSYLPFIKKNISDIVSIKQQQDDLLTIGMIAFNCSINLYDEKKGSFLAFASRNIKNRIIDELRKEQRYNSKVIPLYSDKEDDSKVQTIEEKLSINSYDKEIEKQNLSEEISNFSEELEKFGISFVDLPKISPKWKQTKIQCLKISLSVLENEKFKHKFFKEKRLPQAELAKEFNVSIKTIEKHRKYIVTLIVLLTGNYPNIKSFLPEFREK